MKRVLEIVQQAAPTQATVLLQGGTGTGKELIAHAIHRLSSRAQGPFVVVHCAALSRNLIESELFGHEKGAFTGAVERRIGRFESADGGTLFLDEVSEIEPTTQSKLLRVLEERRFERVGGNESIETDIRLVAATNRDLKALVEKGEFRSDLYFRLNVVSIEIPPLRDRVGDIPLLCDYFLKQLSETNGKQFDGFSAEAMSILTSYSWPGNVRELRNAVESMVVLARGSRISVRDIPPDIRHAVTEKDAGKEPAPPLGPGEVPGSMDHVRKTMILGALKAHRGNRTKAAQQLGISRRTLHRKVREYRQQGVEIPE
jgi:DNA-binding NtrC family response regulator